MSRKLIKDDFFEDILKDFESDIMEAINLEIQLGQSISLETAKNSGVNTKLNPLNVNKTDVNNFAEQVFINIKDANRDMSKRISNTTLENIANKGSSVDLAKQIKAIFQEGNSEFFNYKKRFETIARTESTRILNTSGNNTALKLGAKKKYLSGINDSRQGGDSKVALAKYGDEEKAISVDKNFKFTFGNKVYDYLLPPNRPNDRELVIYTF